MVYWRYLNRPERTAWRKSFHYWKTTINSFLKHTYKYKIQINNAIKNEPYYLSEDMIIDSLDLSWYEKLKINLFLDDEVENIDSSKINVELKDEMKNIINAQKE